MQQPVEGDSRVGLVLNGRYRITALLGEGGMGLVYRGERLQLGRPVAIKFLHSPYAKSPKYMARFEREARAMSKLSHPYCVSVIDFGVHGEPYIVMDFVTGETLRELLDRGPIAPARALQLARQILAGLAHAHGQGVIHRDIKPGNVMIGEATGMGDHVRIFDFGLAKLHDPEAENDHSMATVIGTPAYMSPEQTRAEPIDARADLYAVGILLFEMLTGVKPFVGEDAYAIIRLQREQPAPLLRTRLPELSAALEQVLVKALEKEPDARYQSAAEFAAALDSVPEAAARPVGAGANGSGSPPAAGELRERQPPARSTRLATLGLALVAAVGAFVHLTSDAPPAPTTRRGSSGDPSRTALPAPHDQPISAGSEHDDAAALAEAQPAVDTVDGGEQGSTAEQVDAGLGDEQVRLADQALNESAEQQFVVAAGTVEPPVRSISDVHALIDKGQLDGAVLGLRALRSKSPYNPYLPYLLGELYFERGAWSDGLAKYREAIRLSDGYKKRASIHNNAVRALGNDASYARAHALILRDLGKEAAKALEAAAENGADPRVQERARRLVEALGL